MRHRAESAADIQLKPANSLSVHNLRGRDSTKVMQRNQRARLILAAGKRDFEFSAEVLDVTMPEQIKCQGLRIRRNIKRFSITNTGQGAGRDVADRVATGFARGDSHRRQPAENIGRILNIDKVKLDILPGRNVADGIRIFLSQFRQRNHLLRIHTAIWEFDALHPRRFPECVRTFCQR